MIMIIAGLLPGAGQTAGHVTEYYTGCQVPRLSAGGGSHCGTYGGPRITAGS